MYAYIREWASYLLVYMCFEDSTAKPDIPRTDSPAWEGGGYETTYVIIILSSATRPRRGGAGQYPWGLVNSLTETYGF